jgi:hypothetical protein
VMDPPWCRGCWREVCPGQGFKTVGEDLATWLQGKEWTCKRRNHCECKI